jgi:type I restriction enzyme S subunit
MTSVVTENIYEIQPFAWGELPDGWVRCKLPEISEINMGQSPPGRSYNSRGEGLPFFQGKVDFGDRYPTVRVWCNNPKKIAQPGDILISVRAPVGPTNVADRICAIGRGLAAIRPIGNIPTEFILFRLRLLEPELALSGTGSTFTAINKKDLENIDIDIPPLAEQTRIVAKLEELLARVNAVKKRLARVSTITKRFRQAVLAAACSGRLTAEWGQERRLGMEGWTAVALKDVAQLRLGKMLDKAKNIGKPTRYLRNLNVRWFSFDLSTIAKMRATPEEQKELEINNGDLLVCEGGEPGRCAVWNLGTSDLIFQKAIHRIRVKETLIPHWLALNIWNDANSGRLEDYFTGSTIKHLTGKALATYRFLLPSLAEQNEIIRRVEIMFNLADVVEKRVEAARAKAEKLTQAILAKAFRGELVPTEAELASRECRSYEPASDLLARINADHKAKEDWGKAKAKSSKREITH